MLPVRTYNESGISPREKVRSANVRSFMAVKLHIGKMDVFRRVVILRGKPPAERSPEFVARREIMLLIQGCHKCFITQLFSILFTVLKRKYYNWPSCSSRCFIKEANWYFDCISIKCSQIIYYYYKSKDSSVVFYKTF